MDRDCENTKLWDDYQDGIAYQNAVKVRQRIPKCVRFYEGDQWGKITQGTKNLPRPVVNIVKNICRSKKSAILSVPVKIIYKSDRDGVDVDKFNRFADYIQKEIGQELLDKKGIDDGVKKGSYFYHYYWDAEAKGKDGVKEGGLRGEIIDPLNIFFANPTELDEQKQAWILICSREDVESVKAKADKDVDKEAIASDEDTENAYHTQEQSKNICTVLTRYFRMNGEVYCEKATKTVIINKPFPITPDIESAMRELNAQKDDTGRIKEDAPNNSLPDDATKNDDSIAPDKSKMYLYPVVVGNYEIRENCIYGLGEAEGIIPNQKSINFNLAMSLLNAQEVAWGKYIVTPGALRGQVINNEPGQVLVDYSGTGQGIRKMSEQVMQGQPIQLVDALTSMTRSATGSTEVMTGEVLGSNMSGAAIAQLQGQAQMPVNELRDMFWLVKEKQGKILAQFFRFYYADKEFVYEEDVPLMDNAGNPIPGFSAEKRTVKDSFSSRDYQDTEFSVVVEATAGTNSSAAGDINVLDVLIGKGLISLKTYFKAYPKDALSNREELLKGIEEDENGQIAVLTQKVQAYEAQLQQDQQTIMEMQKATEQVTSVIRENQELRKFIAELYTESRDKIAEANRQIVEASADAQDFANVINGAMMQSQQGTV